MGVVPPLVGVAVKVTLVPEHMVLPGLADMLTLTGRFGLTVIVIAFDVAGPPLWQISLEVRTTVIISPLAGTYAYVALLAPTAVAPLYH